MLLIVSPSSVWCHSGLSMIFWGWQKPAHFKYRLINACTRTHARTHTHTHTHRNCFKWLLSSRRMRLFQILLQFCNAVVVSQLQHGNDICAEPIWHFFTVALELLKQIIVPVLYVFIWCMCSWVCTCVCVCVCVMSAILSGVFNVDNIAFEKKYSLSCNVLRCIYKSRYFKCFEYRQLPESYTICSRYETDFLVNKCVWQMFLSL